VCGVVSAVAQGCGVYRWGFLSKEVDEEEDEEEEDAEEEDVEGRKQG